MLYTYFENTCYEILLYTKNSHPDWDDNGQVWWGDVWWDLEQQNVLSMRIGIAFTIIHHILHTCVCWKAVFFNLKRKIIVFWKEKMDSKCILQFFPLHIQLRSIPEHKWCSGVSITFPCEACRCAHAIINASLNPFL